MATAGVNYSAARVPGALATLPTRSSALHTWILWGRWRWDWRKFRSSSICSGAFKHGEVAKSDNPWQSTTLEWQTPTPPRTEIF